jgi:hypothetical protein
MIGCPRLIPRRIETRLCHPEGPTCPTGSGPHHARDSIRFASVVGVDERNKRFRRHPADLFGVLIDACIDVGNIHDGRGGDGDVPRDT